MFMYIYISCIYIYLYVYINVLYIYVFVKIVNIHRVYIYINMSHNKSKKGISSCFFPLLFVSVNYIITPTKTQHSRAIPQPHLQDLRAQNLDGQVETQAVLWVAGV